MKRLFLLTILLSLVIFISCQEQSSPPQEESQYFMTQGPINSFEMERYENKIGGYIITVPRSWGTYPPFGGFNDDLYNEMEQIGPLMGSSVAQNLDIEVFDENTVRKSNQSWVDFYIDFRLTGIKYDKTALQSTPYPTTQLTRYNSDGSYRDTCRLIENKNKLYVFCYQEGNNIHSDIINSIELM